MFKSSMVTELAIDSITAGTIIVAMRSIAIAIASPIMQYFPTSMSFSELVLLLLDSYLPLLLESYPPICPE